MIVLVVACALAGPWTRPALRPAPLAPVRSRGLQPRGSTLDVPTRGPPSAEGEGEGDRLASDEPGSTAASLALQGVRWAPLAVGVGYLIHPSTLDDAVARVWSALSSLDVVRQPMFEAEVAAGSFWVWIVLFLSLHVLMGPKAAAHRFDQRMPHDPWSFTRVENWPEWAYPFFTYLGSIQLYHMVHPKAALELTPPSFGVLGAEVLCGIFLYDLAFYPLHWLLHNCPLRGVRALHGYHHRAGERALTATETVQHSFWDAFLQVAVNIAVQQVSPFAPFGGKHPLSRIIHNIVVTYLLSESHSGYDLPWMSHRLWPELFGGAPRHERHHHNGRVYYHQFFKYIDDALGYVEAESRAQALSPAVDGRSAATLDDSVNYVPGIVHLADDETRIDAVVGADADSAQRATENETLSAK